MLLWLILVFGGLLIKSVKTRIIYIYEKMLLFKTESNRKHKN